jgi:hypothetical protein
MPACEREETCGIEMAEAPEAMVVWLEGETHGVVKLLVRPSDTAGDALELIAKELGLPTARWESLRLEFCDEVVEHGTTLAQTGMRPVRWPQWWRRWVVSVLSAGRQGAGARSGGAEGGDPGESGRGPWFDAGRVAGGSQSGLPCEPRGCDADTRGM